MTRRLLLAAVLALFAAAPAQAHWRAGGTGAGTAPVDTLAPGVQPTTTVAGTTVTVSWGQTTFHGGRLGTFTGGGYALRRYPAAGGAAVTPSAPCGATQSGTGATLACAEPSVPFGSWRYAVAPLLGAQWTGAESPPSAAVQVRPNAPSPTATAAAGGRIDVAWAAVAGATSYDVLRRTGAGALAPLATVTSPAYADSATVDGTTYGYVVRAVAPAATGGTIASADSAEVTARADATAPAVALTDPGAYLRATVALAYTATDTGSGLASVKVQRAPAGTSTWTDLCATPAAASPCSFDTTLVADGAYDLRVSATDAAGNAGTAVVASRTVDNTKPTATDVQTINRSGGTPGLAEAGDTVVLTASEALAPASILAGWTGAATGVTVRMTAASPSVLTFYNAANSAQLPLGSVSLGRSYATLPLTFANSTMTQSGSTINVVLGTPGLGALLALGSGTMTWTPSTLATDLAGNAMNATAATETGAADADF